MDGLRTLGLGYLAAAMLFCVAAVASHNPQFVPNAKNLEAARAELAARLDYHFIRPIREFLTPPVTPERMYAQPRVFQPLMSKHFVPPPKIVTALPLDIPPPLATEVEPSPPPRVLQVLQHLKVSLTDDMRNYFDLFLYVSKARKGPLSQRMYVVKKDETGQLTVLYDWAASTGREKIERNPAGEKTASHTPAGYYALDPDRMFKSYRSRQWGSSMPYAMFFDFEENGMQSGIAIHAALNKNLSKLGTRASAGCIRLAPKNAKTLFNLIRKDYGGLTPRFAYDTKTQTMSNTGEFAIGGDGKMEFAEGYRVLVFVENYSGTENVVAELL